MGIRRQDYYVPVQLAGQVLEAELVVEVALSLLRAESLPGLLRGDGEGGRDGQLGDKAGTDVHVAQRHDGLVTVVMHRQLEAFAALRGVTVVVGLQVQ